MKTIVLHVGFHKTGTSSIQRTLAANDALLEENGVLFPSEDLSSIGVRWTGSRHHWLGFLVIQQPENWPRPRRLHIPASDRKRVLSRSRECLSQMLETIEGTDANHVVISSEFLCGLDLDEIHRLKRLFSPLDVNFKVVCYYRHPAKAYLSNLQQRLKAQAHVSGAERSYWPVSQL